MQSIRFRLAVYYSLALTVTMVAFGAAVYWERTATAPREAEQRLDATLQNDGELAVRVLTRQAQALRKLGTAGPDSAKQLLEDVKAYFDPMPDYVILADPTGSKLVYLSTQAKTLLPATLDAVSAMVQRRPPPFGADSLTAGANNPPLRYNLAEVTGVPGVGAVLVAGQVQVNASQVREILSAMFWMAPLILVASGLLGYWLADRSLLPVEVMIGELGAIQDGTSLNRRLAVPA
ncbi:MAG: hypothetical protein ABUL71_01860, partial [Gemmatimonadota bacterium]